MKLKCLLLAALAGCVVSIPVAAQVVFDNTDGTFTANGNNVIGAATLALSNSQLVSVTGLSMLPSTAPAGSTVSFTTGTLATGSITAGSQATFNAGGTFTINYGNGVIFQGQFGTPTTWTNIGVAYSFVGTVNGTLFVPGFVPAEVMGATIQLTTIGASFSGNTIQDGPGGKTSFALPAGGLTPAPEPGTLTLLGTGLVGLGVFVRRLRGGATESK